MRKDVKKHDIHIKLKSYKLEFLGELVVYQESNVEKAQGISNGNNLDFFSPTISKLGLRNDWCVWV